MLDKDEKKIWRKKMKLVKRKQKQGKILQKFEIEQIKKLNLKRSTLWEKIGIYKYRFLSFLRLT